MAKYLKGILGSFSGKVGTVIGTYWRGKAVMRSVASHVTNPQTPEQMLQREKFSVTSKFIAAVRPFVNEGYSLLDAGKTPANAAASEILNNGLTVSGTTVTVDLDHAILAKGILSNPDTPSIVQGTGHSADVSWTDNSSTSRYASANDIILLCLYNAAKVASVCDTTNAVRSSEENTLAYPADWVGDTLTLFMSAKSPKGDMIATSIKVGTLVAA